jgi:SPP1 gp7 family putative phage head morphogenesis protein
MDVDEFPDDLDVYEEAIKAFRRRVPMPDGEFDKLVESEREFAFKVAGVSQANVAQEIHDSLTAAIRDGKTLKEFKAEMGDKLTEAWGGEDCARMETVFRNNVLGAYNQGRHAIHSEPHVKAARPYWRFDAVQDNRTTSICDACHGTILPASHRFWREHYPSLHHNCRSVITALTPEEAESEGISPGAPDLHGEKPQQGFGKMPAGEGRDWEPDTDGFSPELRRALEKRID